VVEVARFFDAVTYGETDQAEVQARFRPTGVLYEVGSRLAVSAPGGMFVSVADGEAMVEGFHYKNTTAKQLAIASNTSGATRFDRVVLRLDRVANSLSAVVKQGTPGSGIYPALTQVAGGVWEVPIGGAVVANGALSIVAGNVGDFRVYGNIIHNAVEVGLGAVQGTFAGVQRRVLTTDASGALYFDENAPGRHNFLSNSGFEVNQRSIGNAANNGDYVVDRWAYSTINNVGCVMGTAMIAGSFAAAGSEGGNAVFFTRSTATAIAADTLFSMRQTIEGTEAVHLSGMPMVLSFWVFATKPGVYGVNIEQFGTNWKYLGTFTVNAGSAWEYKTIQVPWTTNGTWAIGTTAGSLVVRFVAAAGATQRSVASNAWVNDPAWAAAAITNPMTALSDTIYIGAPKLEVGTLATRWEPQDYVAELMKAYRHLYVEQGSTSMHTVIHGTQNYMVLTQLPVHMRAVPAFSVIGTPSYTSSGGPTGSQFTLLCAGGFVTGITYSTWTSWLPSSRLFVSMIASSTVAAGIANGQSGVITTGSTLKTVHSAEL
jgi:hypothetical protein